jgi:hypothetical protein
MSDFDRKLVNLIDDVTGGVVQTLTTDEALAVVEESPVSSNYKVHQAPGTLELEDEPDLLFRYAADDLDAIDEVRRRHAERRGPAEEQHRDFWKQRCP